MSSSIWEYFHLVTNPFPVVLALAGVAVGLLGWAARKEALERWGVGALLLAGIAAVPSYVTGLTAADVVEARTFVRPGLVQTHRTWATWTVVVLVGTGAFAAFSTAQPAERRLRRFVLLCGLVATGLVAWTAFLGGRINHRLEEEDGAAAAAEASPPPSPASPAPSDSSDAAVNHALHEERSP